MKALMLVSRFIIAQFSLWTVSVCTPSPGNRVFRAWQRRQRTKRQRTTALRHDSNR